jgi:hypothetical protein
MRYVGAKSTKVGAVALATWLATTGASFAGIVQDPGGWVRTSTAVFAGATPASVIPGNTNVRIGKARTLRCTATAGCVIAVRITAEIVPDNANMLWTLCAVVDDQKTDPTGCFVGDSNSSNVMEGVYDGNLQVSKGNHSVKFFINVANQSSLDTWHEEAQILQ